MLPIKGSYPAGYQRESIVNLMDLHALAQVAEHQSVRAAAQAMDVSRASLRRRLERLEEAVGVPLLLTNNGGMQLTEAGGIVVERGMSLIQQAQAMTEDAQTAQQSPKGLLRLVLPVGMNPQWRILASKAMYAAHPGVRVHVREAEDPLTLLRTPFDMMVLFGPAPPQGDWYSRVLHNVPVGLYASVAYLEEHGEPTTVEQLAEHRVSAWRRPGESLAHLELKAGGVVFCQPMLATTNLYVVQETAEQGLGIGYGATATLMAASVPMKQVLPDLIGTQVALRALSSRTGRSDAMVSAIQKNFDFLVSTILGSSES